MRDEFIITTKDSDKKCDRSVIMTLRLERQLQEEYDKLSMVSGRSRNDLMCRALMYAIDNLRFINDDGDVVEDHDT